jgi:hypothetical protein
MKTAYKTKGISRKDLRRLAMQIRHWYETKDDEPFDVTGFLDKMPLIFEKNHFQYRIVNASDGSNLCHSRPASTDVVNSRMEIFEPFYDAACDKNDGLARFTIAHEIGHYITISVVGLPLYKVLPGEEIKPFENPEWIADQFAAEILMPYDLCKDLTPGEIMTRYQVSGKAAETRKSKIAKEEAEKADKK